MESLLLSLDSRLGGGVSDGEWPWQTSVCIDSAMHAIYLFWLRVFNAKQRVRATKTKNCAPAIDEQCVHAKTLHWTKTQTGKRDRQRDGQSSGSRNCSTRFSGKRCVSAIRSVCMSFCRVLCLCRQLSFLMSFDGAQSWHYTCNGAIYGITFYILAFSLRAARRSTFSRSYTICISTNNVDERTGSHRPRYPTSQRRNK